MNARQVCAVLVIFLKEHERNHLLQKQGKSPEPNLLFKKEAKKG